MQLAVISLCTLLPMFGFAEVLCRSPKLSQPSQLMRVLPAQDYECVFVHQVYFKGHSKSTFVTFKVYFVFHEPSLLEPILSSIPNSCSFEHIFFTPPRLIPILSATS